MKTIQTIQILFLAFIFALFSCTDGATEKPTGAYETGILILNEGAFGANDGEIYHLEPSSGFLKSQVFETENKRPFAGLLQDIVIEGERTYLVANTGKIEIVNSGDFKSRGAVVAELDQPRSLAVNGSQLFISDYGPYDAAYNTPDSYIAIVKNLDGGAVSKKIKISSKPTDLHSVGNYIWVAGSEQSKLHVIDSQAENVFKTIDVAGSPSQFFTIGSQLWVFAPAKDKTYFHRISTSDFRISETVTFSIPNASQKMALGLNSTVYFLTSTGWPSYDDAVAVVSLSNPQQIQPKFITGSGFYGIGFDPNRRELYLANAKGFQGNGDITSYDESGKKLKTLDVGRVPSGFRIR